MNYYLLTFNEDHGDEHNVPALHCFTEEEYNIWLETPSGKIDPDYEKNLEKYLNFQAAKNKLQELIKLAVGENWGNVPYTEWPKDLEEKYRNLHKDYGYSNNWPQAPIKLEESFMNAWLGNNGECFDESYRHLYLMKEFVEAGIVKVFEIDEAFYNTFNNANLSSLSLCNVFEINE